MTVRAVLELFSDRSEGPGIEPIGLSRFLGNLHLVGGDNFSSSSVDDVLLYKRHFQIVADQRKMIQVIFHIPMTVHFRSDRPVGPF